MPQRSIPPAHGFTAPGFESVLDVFKSRFSEGVENGASLAVYWKGSLVVRAWGGFADQQARRPWRKDGYGYFFSGGKFLSAIVIAHLVERGFLKYEEKIATYWPQFAQNGKEEITLSMLLSHSAGLSLANQDYYLQWMREHPEKLRTLLESLHPLWVPGKQHGYSMVLVGLFLNEIVQRVDPKGRSISQYFHDEIATPFEIDAHFGVPKSSFHRTPRLAWQDYTQEQLAAAMADFHGNMDMYQKSLREPRDWNARWRINDPDYASLPSPSSHLIGDPAAMAKLAGILANGGMHDGKVLLGPSQMEALQKPVTYGMDVIHGTNWTYGLGCTLIPIRMGDKCWFLIGHPGLGGQCIWMDPLHGLGFAFCSNYMDPMTTFHNNRWRNLLEVVYGCITKGDPGSLRLFQSYREFLDDLKNRPIHSRL